MQTKKFTKVKMLQLHNKHTIICLREKRDHDVRHKKIAFNMKKTQKAALPFLSSSHTVYKRTMVACCTNHTQLAPDLNRSIKKHKPENQKVDG